MVICGQRFPHVIHAVKGFRSTDLHLTKSNLIRTPMRLPESLSAFFFPAGKNRNLKSFRPDEILYTHHNSQVFAFDL